MGIISRVAYVDGNPITAAGQNANEDTIVNEFNGNIDNTNIKPGANIEGSKLANAPAGIPAGKYNAKSIASADIAYDAAVDANRAITKDHIKNAAIIPRTLNMDIYTSLVGSITAGSTVHINTGLNNTIVPIQLYLTRLVLNSESSLTLTLSYSIVTNTWHISISNFTAVNFNGGGVGNEYSINLSYLKV